MKKRIKRKRIKRFLEIIKKDMDFTYKNPSNIGRAIRFKDQALKRRQGKGCLYSLEKIIKYVERKHEQLNNKSYYKESDGNLDMNGKRLYIGDKILAINVNTNNGNPYIAYIDDFHKKYNENSKDKEMCSVYIPENDTYTIEICSSIEKID